MRADPPRSEPEGQNGTWLEPIRGELYIELIDAIAAIRGFFDARPETGRLDAADLRRLERLFDRYQAADDAFGEQLEVVISSASKRPRR